jgi:hypothetical protein
MLLRLSVVAALVATCVPVAADNYDTLTHSVIRCVIKRDSIGIAALLPAKAFDYCITEATATQKPTSSKINPALQSDGYFSYEKKLTVVSARDLAASLTNDCGVAFNRAKYPVAQSDFSQVNIEGKKRVEIVCKALCGKQGVHFVFVKDSAAQWKFVGIWWEKARTDN